MKNKVIISKLAAYAEKVMLYCNGLSYSDFSSDTMLVEACVFNLSQMGELANRLEDSFTSNYPDILWHALYGLRNRIIHDYEGVNLTLVWDIIQNDLPELILKLNSLLSRFESKLSGEN